MLEVFINSEDPLDKDILNETYQLTNKYGPEDRGRAGALSDDAIAGDIKTYWYTQDSGEQWHQ